MLSSSIKFKYILIIYFFYLILSPNINYAGVKGLIFHGGYVFETFKGQENSAVYLTILNNSEKNFKIKSIKTKIAKKAEVHDVRIKNDIVEMFMIKNFDIKKKSEIYFQPGAKHIMLFGLKKKLTDGDSFKIIFYFQNNQSVETEVLVLNQELKENYLN